MCTQLEIYKDTCSATRKTACCTVLSVEGGMSAESHRKKKGMYEHVVVAV